MHLNAELPGRVRFEGAGQLALPRRSSLTTEEMHAVLTRNSIGRVHHKLADGIVRTSRIRYAPDGSSLYIPAWTTVESWYAARLPTLECHVSEVDSGTCWRYIRLRGEVTPLHPTGAPTERAAWRQGIAVLRRAITDLPPTDELALANFGIVQMDIEFWDGSVVHWEEEASELGPPLNAFKEAETRPPRKVAPELN